jgi:SAM-dependent methyltransferase
MSAETFQLPLAAAEIYESEFVPAIFAEWAPLLVGMAGVRPGQAVLDVACGTGIVARVAADHVGTEGVVGVDLNEAMLTVARRVRPELEWRRADALALPFPGESFDTVLCQMALMFFPDRPRAVAEMARVTRDGGRIGLVVPAAIEDQPAYRLLVDIVREHAGQDGASLLDTYWSCGDLGGLRRLVEGAGLRPDGVRTHIGTARFGSPDDLVTTEVEGSPLAERISAETYRRIRRDAGEALRPFIADDGTLHAPLHGHVLIATKAS